LFLPNGTDVYAGVPKDYVCNSVRPDIFLKVLQGHKIEGVFGTGKTINSGPNDNIFVYFSDHGAKGIVGFGEDFLKATALNKAISNMYSANKYKKMVFYVEACESGSMFKGLLDPKMNVYATTASNATTSSYACYFDKMRKTFLGDVYSIKWLEDSDREDIEKETLQQQFLVVKNETNTSMVMQFGDMSISQLPVGDFQGPKPVEGLFPPPPVYPDTCGRDAVPGPDVPVRILQNNVDAATSEEEAQDARNKLNQLLKNRKFMNSTVHNLVHRITQNNEITGSIFTDNVELTQYSCYYPAVDEFHSKCFNLGRNDYALRMLNTLVNLCEQGFAVEDIVEAIKDTCTHPPIVGIH
jgi:legumain